MLILKMIRSFLMSLRAVILFISICLLSIALFSSITFSLMMGYFSVINSLGLAAITQYTAVNIVLGIAAFIVAHKYTNKIIFNILDRCKEIISAGMNIDNMLTGLKIKKKLFEQRIRKYFLYEQSYRDSQIDIDYQKHSSNNQNETILAAAKEAYVNDAKIAYHNYLSRNIHNITSIQVPDAQLNALIDWYKEFSSNLIVSWSLKKESIYLLRENDKDGFLDRVSEQNINKTKSNHRYICPISYNIMRDPVYILTSNNIKCYFDRLSLEKYIHSCIIKGNDTKNPLTNEPINPAKDIHFDQGFKNEIYQSLHGNYNLHSTLFYFKKISYKIFDLLFVHHEPIVLDLFDDKVKWDISRELETNLHRDDVEIYISAGYASMVHRFDEPLARRELNTQQQFFNKYIELHNAVNITVQNNTAPVRGMFNRFNRVRGHGNYANMPNPAQNARYTHSARP